MRIILFTLFLFTTCLSIRSQSNDLTIETIEKLSTFSLNEFEEWALNYGLTFNTIEDYGHYKAIIYSKKNDIAISQNYRESVSTGGIYIQTVSKELYLKLKKDCLKKGFVFDKTESYDNGDHEILYYHYNSENHKLAFSSVGGGYYPYNIYFGLR